MVILLKQITYISTNLFEQKEVIYNTIYKNEWEIKNS